MKIEVDEIMTELPQTPPDRDIIARAIYETEPMHECGEYVDGFQVSPGGDLSWEQALARDDEFAPKYMHSITKFAFDAADRVIAALSLSRSPAEPTPFYGAQCPDYPNCTGGCGLGCTHETAHNVRDATIKEIARYLDEEGHGIPAEKVRFMGPAVTRPYRETP